MDNDKRKDLGSPELAAYWLSAIIESAEDAIISKTLDGIITSWNRGAERIFGYEAHEIVGKPVTILIPADHLDEEPTILARITAGERIDHYETIRLSKSGQPINISLTVSPIRGADGSVVGASKVARDITARKAAEKALREQAEIIETVNRLGQTIAGELDLTKLVQAVTDAAAEVSGAQYGAFFYNVLDPENESDMLYALSGTTRESFADFPMLRKTDIFSRLSKANGTVLIADVRKDPRFGKNSPYYEMSKDHPSIKSYLVVPVVSRDNEVYGGLFLGHPDAAVFSERSARIVEGMAAQAAVAMDNARLFDAAAQARREAEHAARENERLYRQAQESNQLKEEFLATVSHELRNPLNAILGWSRMLRSGNLPEDESARAIGIIERNAIAQAQLIDDLLDVSRIIAGKLRMDVRPADPSLFIEAALEAVKPAADAKGIRLQKLLDTALVTVHGDPGRLQQVIWNLLSNAIKFTDRGGRVQVRLERVNSSVEITVSDTGQGIPVEFLPHVFERFRQADQGSAREHTGMGLGLAIVKHLIELHGGSVHAASPGRGQGSTFTVRLPLAPVHHRENEGERVHPAASDFLPDSEYSDRLDGLTILVVDDEEDTRELLKTGLEGRGARVRVAESSAKALQALEGEAVDILISDIGMPGQDGYELIRNVRSFPGFGVVPAIALTAYARVEDRLRALRSGYQMHVPKPVELAELVAVIQSLVRRHHSDQ